MPIASADIHKTVNTVWDASTLNASFLALRDASVNDDEFPVLNDQEATPEEPFPYCVFEITSSSTTDRMSGIGSTIREIRDVSFNFHVHTREIDGDSRTAKEIAAALAEEVMKVFGGHPVVAATDLVLDNGNFLISEWQNDFGVRLGKDDEYRWDVMYIFRIDVPLAV